MGRGVGSDDTCGSTRKRFERPEGWPINVERSALPSQLYHVALASNRSRIQAEGLDASARTWNVGGPTLDHWRGEWLWYDFGNGPEAIEYRPEGVYVYGELESAEECVLMYAAGHGQPLPRDIWQISTSLIPATVDVILDPASLRWEGAASAYVFERIPARALTLLQTDLRGG